MTRRIDISGQRFARMTVLGVGEVRITPGGQRKTYWDCVCDCGVRKTVEGQALREGRVKSCGCFNRDSNVARGHQLAGFRFGRLVAQQKGETLPDGSTTWVCRCDCGVVRAIRTSLLTTGNALSCGCLQSLMSAHRRWTGNDVTYFGMHDRLRGSRGAAKTHACADCGERAQEWSYNGGDPEQKFELVHGKWLLAYSTDPDFYSPRCRPCHRRHDAELRKEAS